MFSILRAGALALMGACSLPAFAESCYVSTEPAMAGPSGAHTQTCYEFQGTPEGAMDWSCNDTTKDVQKTHREKRASCPSGHFGRCVSALTQETLGNQASAGRKGEGVAPPQVGRDARLVTYYYQAQDKAQSKTDCENAGGRWEAP
ncbi:hypothetical protein [Pseudomonas mangiferae]|uniref:Lipoprotein n=1 Tax=Pseudomonas mangiferae TaxID=2593654 RepID=A0A553GTZ3_9PSED|nr:hypothetical protein [Pseudomonas mangiferae]TRX72975.1 hypothetical protein FM069_20180 [Pseudomonas mangiferae]